MRIKSGFMWVCNTGGGGNVHSGDKHEPLPGLMDATSEDVRSAMISAVSGHYKEAEDRLRMILGPKEDKLPAAVALGVVFQMWASDREQPHGDPLGKLTESDRLLKLALTLKPEDPVMEKINKAIGRNDEIRRALKR